MRWRTWPVTRRRIASSLARNCCTNYEPGSHRTNETWPTAVPTARSGPRLPRRLVGRPTAGANNWPGPSAASLRRSVSTEATMTDSKGADDLRTVLTRLARLSVEAAVEAVRADQERRWACGEEVPAERYLEALPR